MKRFFLFFSLIFFLTVSCSLFKSKKDLSHNYSEETTDARGELYEKAFVFLLYSTDQVVTCEQNITSILDQKYDNYRIILMETQNVRSCSNILNTTIGKKNKGHLLLILSFDDEKPTLACFQKAFDCIKNDEIVIQLECNDWLANNHVLEKLNEVYSSSPDIWLTYSQYLEYPSYQKGTIDPYIKNMLRNRTGKKIPWLSSYLKTYYADLFKKIKHETSFNYKHALAPETLDLYLMPLAEYAKNHIRFIDDVLYVHNSNLDPTSPTQN